VSAGVRERASKDWRRVAFLRAVFSQVVLQQKDQEIGPLALASLISILAYEQVALTGGNLEGDITSPGALMRENVLHYFLSQKYADDGRWMSFARSIKALSTPRRCFHCGRLTTSIEVKLRVVEAFPRRLTTCPKCGLVEDSPIDCDFQLSANKSTVKITGQLPKRHWNAGLILRSRLPSDNQKWEWPSRPDGSPEETFTIPEPWPCGPIDIYLYFLWGASLAVLSEKNSTQYRETGPDGSRHTR